MKREILKSTQGITLIALIITIIVMLILVGVTVTTALDTKLFQQAQEATQNTQIAKEEESKIAEGKIKVGNSWVDINYYASGLGGTTGGATIDFSAKNVGDVISEYTAGGLTWRLLKKDATTATIIAKAPMDFENIRSENALKVYTANNYLLESYASAISEVGFATLNNVITDYSYGQAVSNAEWSKLQQFDVSLNDCFVAYFTNVSVMTEPEWGADFVLDGYYSYYSSFTPGLTVGETDIMIDGGGARSFVSETEYYSPAYYLPAITFQI